MWERNGGRAWQPTVPLERDATGWCIQHLKCHLRLSVQLKYFISLGEYEQELSWSDIISGDV